MKIFFRKKNSTKRKADEVTDRYLIQDVRLFRWNTNEIDVSIRLSLQWEKQQTNIQFIQVHFNDYGLHLNQDICPLRTTNIYFVA